jgi:hypothetical protein
MYMRRLQQETVCLGFRLMKKLKKQSHSKLVSTKLDDCEMQNVRGGDGDTLGKVVMDSNMRPT